MDATLTTASTSNASEKRSNQEERPRFNVKSTIPLFLLLNKCLVMRVGSSSFRHSSHWKAHGAVGDLIMYRAWAVPAFTLALYIMKRVEWKFCESPFGDWRLGTDGMDREIAGVYKCLEGILNVRKRLDDCWCIIDCLTGMNGTAGMSQDR